MERCLHHPKKGYYARNIRGIGSKGDFTTAPELSDAPAKAIASWAATALKKHHCRHLIEIGPGLGTLAQQVFCNLPLSLRFRTKLHLVESSPSLARVQQERLGKRAKYHPDIHSALAACSGSAVIYSNELVDAFPARIFELTDNGWQELGITRNGNSLQEVKIPVEQLPQSSAFTQEFPIGQRVEIHESYHNWLKSWLPSWKNGEMLTIDYGNTVEQLYQRRPKGTIRSYFLHQRGEGSAVYENPGFQDLTADVNFTDLQNWAQPWLKTSKIENFAPFIQPFLPENNTRFLQAAENFLTISQSPSSANP